jgi:hypothetical protein
MIRLFSACVLLCAFLTVPAEAKPLRQAQCVEAGTVMAPSCMGHQFPRRSAIDPSDHDARKAAKGNHP